ncbi:hypothetical protein EFP84_17620 [Leptospira kmetyi]|uniref:Uncharacterized protein n=1 Tax=Leptospira kmetyi TaxID=408139 RepID=A0AAD0UVZ8_9LEPT|nr:hypothetical protein EFP84_17620 [Leptospira kmetyi]
MHPKIFIAGFVCVLETAADDRNLRSVAKSRTLVNTDFDKNSVCSRIGSSGSMIQNLKLRNRSIEKMTAIFKNERTTP